MDFGGPTFVLAIIAISTIGWIATSWIRARHGYPVEGEWGGKTIKPVADSKANEALKAENAELREQIAHFADRVKVLERIVTDKSVNVAAQIEALRHYASFISQSSIFQKATQPSARLEAELARWLEAPDAVLCQSGYAANLGLLQVIAEPGSPVYIDALAHMSLWEGVRAAGACARPFRHNSPEHLARCIRAHGPGLVVVDAVYSTTGALCPLAEIVEVAERGGCMIVVDESHSLGTHGPQGRGLCVALGLSHRVHFITASLAKAFAGRAGFFTLPA